jgi:hypothetical protein
MLLYTRAPLLILAWGSAGQSVIEQHKSMTRAGQIMPARLWLQGTQEIKFIQVFNPATAPGATLGR